MFLYIMLGKRGRGGAKDQVLHVYCTLTKMLIHGVVKCVIQIQGKSPFNRVYTHQYIYHLHADMITIILHTACSSY